MQTQIVLCVLCCQTSSQLILVGKCKTNDGVSWRWRHFWRHPTTVKYCSGAVICHQRPSASSGRDDCCNPHSRKWSSFAFVSTSISAICNIWLFLFFTMTKRSLHTWMFTGLFCKRFIFCKKNGCKLKSSSCITYLNPPLL